MKVLGINQILNNVTNVMVDFENPPSYGFFVRRVNGDESVVWTIDGKKEMSKTSSQKLEAAYQEYLSGQIKTELMEELSKTK